MQFNKKYILFDNHTINYSLHFFTLFFESRFFWIV